MADEADPTMALSGIAAGRAEKKVRIVCECGSDDFNEVNIWTMNSRLDALLADDDGDPDPQYSGDTEWGECALIDAWLCRRCDKEIPGPNVGAWSLVMGRGVFATTPDALRQMADDLELAGDFTLELSGVTINVVRK